VVNISLGGSASKPLDNAVKKCANKGIYIAIAAGNDGKPAKNYSPARVEATNVFTVSAYDNTGKFALTFSNFGSAVNYSAPGVSIYSCYKAGKYATLSGTSMAAPHMAGILLVNGNEFTTNGYATGDPDTPDDFKAHL
jgi:subtilisin